MGRKTHSGQWPRGEGRLQANRENRGGRVLKVFRRVDDDSFSIIGGALSELTQSEDIPPVRTATKADAYILDPRLMPRNFNAGFITGYQFGRITTNIQKDEDISDEGYDVHLGDIDILDNNRTVIAEIKSERINRERASLYCIMGQAGVKGFTGNGHRRGHRDGTGPTIVIGTFSQAVPKSDKESYINVIETGVQVSLASANAGRIGLGELQVRTYMVA